MPEVALHERANAPHVPVRFLRMQKSLHAVNVSRRPRLAKRRSVTKGRAHVAMPVERLECIAGDRVYPQPLP